MSLNLVMARCGGSPLLIGETEFLTQADSEALLDSTSMEGSCALALRLPSGLMAVGRREAARCVWWVGDDFPIHPPHALWTQPGLFTAEGEGGVSAQVDLEAIERTSRAAKTVAGAIRMLREGESPVFILSPAEPGACEALALTIAAVLGGRLSVSVGHPSPDPARYRLGVGAVAPDGYTVIEATDPPDEGEDRVAWYARDRLGIDPAALFVPGGVDEAAVRDRLRAGPLPGEHSAEGRVRALLARIRAGAELDPTLRDELLALTVLTADARPWQALGRRPAVIRRQAVEALLPLAHELKPTAALLEALSAVYPKGAPLAPWCVALLDWTRRAKRAEPFIAAIEHAIEAWPQSSAQANRVSVWTELVRILVEREKHREAERAVTGPLAHSLIAEGSGVAVATLWGALPPDQRNPRKLVGLVERFARRRDGDRAAAQLFRHVQDNPAEVALVLKTWLSKRGARGVHEEDALFEAVCRTEHFPAWLDLAIEAHPPAVVLPRVSRAATGPEDPVWLDAEAVLAKRTPASQRFANLASLSSGAVALEPLARALIVDALAEARFPDPAMAETSLLLSEVPGSASIWPWVAVAAAAPGRFADEVVDGTVVALCEHPPSNSAEKGVCVRVAERLGGAASWEPLDHARWVVRLALAPDGDQTGFSETLIEGLVSGLIARFDAGPHVGRLVVEMMQLPPDHPALVGLLLRWLPAAWSGRIPASFIEVVECAGVPPVLEDFWNRLAH